MSTIGNTKGGGKGGASSSNNVIVCVRIRPENDAERKAGQPVAFTAADSGVEELDEGGHVSKTWPYDYAFGPDCNNRYIFDTAGASLIESAIEGYNTVMFMYGQTSSGKTFTLFGGGGVLGVVDHSIEMLYNSIMNSTETEYVVKIMFIELYNEEIKDLLATEHNENLKIIEDPILGPSIMNIHEENFVNISETRRILDEGDRRRHFGVTNMNAHSSRSHVMVRMNIEARKVYGGQPSKPLRQSWGKDKPTCFSTLNLVDLAGSERANKAGTSGQSLKEGSYINKSLLTLGTVIAHLSDESKSRAHIPYRNSKLTRLLATALGGNARTSMVACISPARGNSHESLSTLRFASRAKRVVNIVRKNLFDDARSLAELLAKQKTEMDVLREELERSKLHGFSEGPMKEKAANASKRLRSLRFIVMNSSHLVKALGKEGKHGIAKNIRLSVRAAVQGGRDITEVLDEHRDVMLNHFANDPTMMKTVAVIDRFNDSDSIAERDDDDNSVTSNNNMMSSLGAADIGDIVGDLMDEAHEMDMETALMSIEDLRNAACGRISILVEESNAQIKQIAEYKRLNNELTGDLRTTSAEVEALTFAEGALKRTVDEVKRQMNEARVDHIEKASQMQRQIDDLEAATEVGEKSVMAFQQSVSAKDHEILRLQQSVEQLTKDVEKRDAEMRIFQGDSAKSKNQQRTQMEQLRSNMHSMRTQGGETTKVLELQNSFLHRDCELLRDELDAVRSSKNQLSHEVTLLRADVQRYVSEFQQMSEELSFSKSTAAGSSQQVVGLKSRVARVTTRCSFLEDENSNIKRQLAEANNELVSATEIRTTEMKAIKASTNVTIAELRNALSVATNELQCSQELLKSKDIDLQRYVAMLQNDEHRLESRLRMEVTRNETLLNELSSERMHYNDSSDKMASDNRALKGRIQQLEQWLASVHSFIGRYSDSNNDPYGDGLGTVDYDDEGLYSDVYMEDRDIFDTDYNASSTGATVRHPGAVSWSGEITPETSPKSLSPRSSFSKAGSGSPRGLGLKRLSFDISGTFVSSGSWDNVMAQEEEDAKLFQDLKSPNSNKGMISPGGENTYNDAELNLNLPHVSSLRKLFPLSSALSMDPDTLAYKDSSPKNMNIDTTNTSGKRRLESIYEKSVNKPSLAYLRLKFGLKALKTSWTHTVNEDSLLRNYLVSVADLNYTSCHSSDRAVSKSNKQTAFLQSRVDELEASRDDVVQTYSDLHRRIEELNDELNTSREQYADVSVALESVTGAGEVLQSEKAVLRAQFDNIQLDYDNLFYERNNMVLNTKRMKLSMNELQLANDLLQGKLDQVMQRLSITVVQRDELVRQFIDNGKFEEDENGVETLNTPGDKNGSSYANSPGNYSDDEDSITESSTGGLLSIPRALRRKSSFRSDGSDRFIPWA